MDVLIQWSRRDVLVGDTARGITFASRPVRQPSLGIYILRCLLLLLILLLFLLLMLLLLLLLGRIAGGIRG